MNADMEKILKEFQYVFKELDKLPLCRTHDHSITLVEVPNQSTLNHTSMELYKKDVIEKMTQEMLKSRVIQNSSSSFSSPVVLVKKKKDREECVLTIGF